jgi:subtilisin family serine protease
MPLRRTPLAVLALLALAALVFTPFASARRDAAAVEVQFVVGFDGGVSAAQRAKVLAAAGVRVEETISKLDAVVVSDRAPEVKAALAELRADGAVAYAARQQFFKPVLAPNDPGYTTVSWPYLQTSLPNAWDVSTGAATTVVAVIDSGLEAGHADLPALTAGYDFVNNDADPADDMGHGTEVTGVVGALLNNGVGAAGVCPGCTVMPIKAVDGLTGIATDTVVAQSIVWAADHGAKVINLSIAGPGSSQVAQDAVNYAKSKDAVVIAAAGNDSTTDPMYPAALDGVIGVAGTEASELLAAYSNRGSIVELAAPGCFQTTTLGGGYGQDCGTSFASPLVAGIVALVRSRYPGLNRAQVESALIDSANKLPNVDVKYGIVDAYRALTFAGSMVPVPANTSLPTISGTPKEGEKLTATQGAWNNNPTSYTYEWQRCNGLGAACAAISGATASTYKLLNTDVASTFRVKVTAKNAGGDSVPATSAQTALVTGTAPVKNTGVDVYATISASSTAPAIGSSVDYTVVVGAREGTISPDKAVLVFTLPTGFAITSSSGTRATCATVGQKVTCELEYLAYPLESELSVAATVKLSGTVTALAVVTPSPDDAKPEDNTVTQTVTVPGPETPGLPPRPVPDSPSSDDTTTTDEDAAKSEPTPKPLSIGGPAKVGKRLTANPGTAWKGESEPLGFKYQWQTCATVKGKLRCANLRGKTAKTLVVSKTFVGKRLRVLATAVFDGGKRQRRASRLTAAVRR